MSVQALQPFCQGCAAQAGYRQELDRDRDGEIHYIDQLSLDIDPTNLFPDAGA